MQGALYREPHSEECRRQPGEEISLEKGKRLFAFLLTGLLACSLMVSGVLAFDGCFYSCFDVIDANAANILMNDNALIHILLVFFTGLLLWAIYKSCFEKLSAPRQEKICRIVLSVSGILLFAAGTFFVQVHPYYPAGDQLNVTAGAYYCLQGDYSMLRPGGYIGLYQQQKGFMFLYEILFTLFGDYCYDIAGQFHVFFAVLTLLSGYGFLKNESARAFDRILYCVLMLLCLPFLFYLPYIYGDIPAICFCMVLFWAMSSYGKTLRKRYVTVASVAAALALLCRMNTWIVLIAVAIGAVLLALEHWNYKPLIAGLCVLLCAAGAVQAVDVMYEYRSGYESGIGIPSVLWIAMGLQETDGEAGVYNRYQQTVFGDCDFQQEPAARIGKEYISARIKEFQNDLPMAADFFQRKMRSQWLEPLFESLSATETFREGSAVPGWMQSLYYGDSRVTAWKGANYYQSIVYVGVLLCILGRSLSFRERKGGSMGWIPQIAIIGGFLFSLMWENQCRYCLPYYIFMLLYVPEGMMQIGGWVSGFRNKLTARKASSDREREKLGKAL